ncbi:MAG TPA: ScpA family protein, partial [Nevskia sp.]|nr:ScpA family protein [Nevskia sp.]
IMSPDESKFEADVTIERATDEPALVVDVEGFEGPLDLLLALARQQKVDLAKISILALADQYLTFIEEARKLRLELAADYLVMAAMLAEIKSRLLLPRPPLEEGLEEDPRAELVRRLQEYERFKKAAEEIEAMPRQDRDFSVASAFVVDRNVIRLPPPVELRELLLALKDVLKRAELTGRHAIQREALSVRNRMSDVLKALGDGEFHPFERLFNAGEGRLGIIVTFLALLELAKEHLIEIMQGEPLAPIYLKSLATG